MSIARTHDLVTDLDGDRLVSRLLELRGIGATPRQGVTREAYGVADTAARTRVRRWLTEAGLDVEVDAVGNLVGRLPGTGPRWLATGSHLDTVIDGGWLDGAYGVVAAVEVAAAIAAGPPLRHGLIVAAFANEEGAQGSLAMTGSRAVVGALPVDELDRRDDEGVRLRDRIEAAGGDPDRIGEARWATDALDAFVELHIEQGPVLDHLGLAAGVVPAITGRQALEIIVGGRPNHAGTTPMDLRSDALVAAAEVVLAVEAVAREGHVRVATCGHVTASPNVRNVVPGRVVLSAEVRDTDGDRMLAAVDRVRERAATIAAARGVDVRVEARQFVAPVVCDPAVVDAVTAAVDAHVAERHDLPSGAGHDAQVLATAAPVGMIFVPSIGGISHAPTEDTDPDHLVTGARILLDAIRRLDALDADGRATTVEPT